MKNINIKHLFETVCVYKKSYFTYKDTVMNSKLQFDNAISIMLAMPVTKLAKKLISWCTGKCSS